MKKMTVVRKGKEIDLTANRKYLMKVITDPRSERVKGFENKDMPHVLISDKEVEILVENLVTLTGDSSRINGNSE